jgi:protein TonB
LNPTPSSSKPNLPKLAAGMLAIAFALSDAIPATPPSIDDPVGRARIWMKRGEYYRALALLDAVLQADKKNVPAQITASAACLGLQDPECSEKHLKVVASLAPDSPGYQLLRGRTALLRADRAAADSNDKKQIAYAHEAADAFSKALAESPSPTTLSLLAMAQRAGKQTAEAKATYMAWIEAAPRDPNAYGATAAFLAETAEWSEAEKLAASAPQDDPRLAHDIRVAVMRNGMTAVPWETIRPFFDAVEAEETDPGAREALRAYRIIRTSKGRANTFAMLDYLDVDPEDHLNVSTLLVAALDASVSAQSADGIVEPEIQKRVDPIFPEIARLARIEGRVVIACRIKKDGTTGSVHVINTSNPMFNNAALTSIRQSQYSPATLQGEPVEYVYTIRVDFRFHR